MIKTFALASLAVALTGCVGTVDTPCMMPVEVLATANDGPIQAQLIGARTLCLSPEGDATLTPVTATIRLTNTGRDPVALTYMLPQFRAFRSVAVWPADQPDETISLSIPPLALNETGLSELTLAPGADFEISSWTRHHSILWQDQDDSRAQNWVVQFQLNVSYVRDRASREISEQFTIPMRTIAAKPG